MDSIGNPLAHINDFELQNFTDNPNFDFINFIRGDQTEYDPVPGFDLDLINPCFIGQNQFDPTHGDLFDEFNNVDKGSTAFVPDPDSNVADSLPSFDGDSIKVGDDEDSDDEEDSSETTNTTTKRKRKVDRSRTLISERRRRGKMKEKLYALRSLVPNITKMDKSSIVGDAVAYVEDLQMQAKKLKAEIAGLEASLLGAERYQESIKKNKKIHISPPVCKKIIQMDVFQVEERGFYVRLVSSKGQGVAASLYKALESLTSFHVQNSNLTTVSDRFLLTFTLNGTDYEQSLNMPNLKLWITGSLLNQGFEYVTPFTS